MRAYQLPIRQANQHIMFTTRSYHSMRATAGGTFGCQYFGEHAASTNCTASTTSHFFELYIASHCLLDESCICMFAWISRVQTRLICEDNQRIGIYQIRH